VVGVVYPPEKKNIDRKRISRGKEKSRGTDLSFGEEVTDNPRRVEERLRAKAGP